MFLKVFFLYSKVLFFQENDANANEKIKKLKDAKLLISEKTIPKSIKILQRIGIAAILGWLVTSCN